MKSLLKILGINVLAFIAYSLLILFLIKDAIEGMFIAFLSIIFIGLHGLVNLILTTIYVIKKNTIWKHHALGLILVVVVALLTHHVLN